MPFLGHDFANVALLNEALTTPSYRMDHPKAIDNQRLEFLGDAVLGLLAAERLYAACPMSGEGELTVSRTQLVSTAALCAAANRIGLLSHLKRNRAASPMAPNAKTLADAIEALIGAAYLDGGLVAARAVFESLDLSLEEGTLRNPKGDLQIYAQALKPPQHPVYELLKTSGKAHAPVFTVRVSVEGLGSSTSSAHSHKEAEAQAAAKLLQSIQQQLGM